MEGSGSHAGVSKPKKKKACIMKDQPVMGCQIPSCMRRASKQPRQSGIWCQNPSGEGHPCQEGSSGSHDERMVIYQRLISRCIKCNGNPAACCQKRKLQICKGENQNDSCGVRLKLEILAWTLAFQYIQMHAEIHTDVNVCAHAQHILSSSVRQEGLETATTKQQ